jgi:excisionase family DNA binding protein
MMLTVADVCERLQCGSAKVYRLVRSGHLRAHKGPGRNGALRVREDDLHAYLVASLVHADAPVGADA